MVTSPHILGRCEVMAGRGFTARCYFQRTKLICLISLVSHRNVDKLIEKIAASPNVGFSDEPRFPHRMLYAPGSDLKSKVRCDT